MNRGKLEVVKQEMARVDVDILGISELKWTGMGELYLLLWAGISQKKWSGHNGQQKSLKCSTWMRSQKRQNDLCLFPRQTTQYHKNQVYAPTTNGEEAEVKWFYEDLQDLLELTPKKDALFIIGDWNAKVGSQETPGNLANLALEYGMKKGKG